MTTFCSSKHALTGKHCCPDRARLQHILLCAHTDISGTPWTDLQATKFAARSAAVSTEPATTARAKAWTSAAVLEVSVAYGLPSCPHRPVPRTDCNLRPGLQASPSRWTAARRKCAAQPAPRATTMVTDCRPAAPTVSGLAVCYVVLTKLYRLSVPSNWAQPCTGEKRNALRPPPPLNCPQRSTTTSIAAALRPKVSPASARAAPVYLHKAGLHQHEQSTLICPESKLLLPCVVPLAHRPVPHRRGRGVLLPGANRFQVPHHRFRQESVLHGR